MDKRELEKALQRLEYRILNAYKQFDSVNGDAATKAARKLNAYFQLKRNLERELDSFASDTVGGFPTF